MSDLQHSKVVCSLFVFVIALSLNGCGNDTEGTERPQSQDVMEDPLWYRSLSDAAMVLAAQKRLDLMTSTSIPANRAGPIKDELALLCRSDSVVDLVEESFRRRKGVSNAQLSAYMEIFGRIRHPRFARLLADGLGEARQEVQMNALEAAVIQRSAELVPYLLEAFKSKDGYVGRKILSALIGIDSPAARSAICKSVEHKEESIAVMALSAVGGMQLTDALPEVLKRIYDGPDQVRVMAAWAAARMGQSSGARSLVRFAVDRSFGAKARAQALQNLTLLRWWGAGKGIRPLREATVAEVVLESHVFLASARDSDELVWLDQALEGDDPLDRDIALRVCGRTGDSADLLRVLAHREKLTPREMVVFARSLLMGRPEGSLSFIAELIDTRPALRLSLINLVGQFGRPGLRVLEDQLDRDTGDDSAWTLSLIGAVGIVGHPEAETVLKRFDASPDRRIWRFARENIRLIEQRLLKSALPEYRRPTGNPAQR